MKKDIKRLIVEIAIPLVLGVIVGLLTRSGSNYNNIVQPSFAPPAILFPIVWSILYILMGVSSSMIDDASSRKIYYIQLIVNLLWSFVFFTFKLYLLSFIWIIVLIALVTIMIIKFSRESKLAAYLQIPYLIWLLFASFLNLSIYLLN